MAFRYTPTPTPSITPTISLTPSITPTITPTTTACPDVCCFPSTVNQFTTNGQLYNLYVSNDYKLVVQGAVLGSYYGTPLNWNNWFDTCGNLLKTLELQGIRFLGVPGGYATEQQSTGDYIVLQTTGVGRVLKDTLTQDFTFQTGVATGGNTEFPFDLTVDAQDRIYVCGRILSGWTYWNITGNTQVNTNQNLIRLNPNGTVDLSYSGITLGTPSTAFSPYGERIFKDSQGRILLVGFPSWNGDTTRRGLIRLNADGTLDSSFKPLCFTAAQALLATCGAEDMNGDYYVGGSFTSISGITAQRFLIRIFQNGNLDTSFVFGENSRVYDLQVQSTGKVVIVDADIDVKRINSNGSLDTTFTSGTTNSGAGTRDITIAKTPQGNLFIGGAFTQYNGINYRQLVKTDANGNLEMCPEPSPTPTMTPTQSITPTRPIISPTPTNTSTPTITPTPSITPPSGELFVYAKYRNAESILQYQVNYGAYEVIGNIDSLTCQYYYTITGLTAGDVIYFTTYSTCVLALDTSSPCPNSGFACSQTYNFPGGTNYAYITVDGSICC